MAHSMHMTVTLYRESGGTTRYYSLYNAQDLLFGGYECTAVWGTDLNRGRKKVYNFRTRREMWEKMRSLLQKRFQDGYRLLYSFSREKDGGEVERILPETAAARGIHQRRESERVQGRHA